MLNSIDIIEIHAEAHLGESIDRVLRDALLLAIQQWRTVRVRFNDSEYVVRPESLMDAIERPY